MNGEDWDRFTAHCGVDIKLAVYRFKSNFDSTKKLSSQTPCDRNFIRSVAVLVAGDFVAVFWFEALNNQ